MDLFYKLYNHFHFYNEKPRLKDLFREYILEIFENLEISMIHLMKYCEIEFVCGFIY